MNKIIINGNLTNDMEVIVSKNYTVGNFTLANNEGYGDNQKTTFVRCSIFGEKRVESLEKYLLKGARVLLNGKLEITSKEDKEGYKNYTSIIVDELEILKFVNDEEEEKKDRKRGRR